MRNIVFIHGALGDATQMESFAHFFKTAHQIHIINLKGHGVDSGNDAIFSMQQMVDDVAQVIQENMLKEVVIFGFSMGGYIGMCLAKQYPELVNALITIGTKYEWSYDIALAQSAFFDTNKIVTKQPAFATSLSNVHGDNWKKVVEKTGNMIHALGHAPLLHEADYKNILCPTMIMLGDRDRMVSTTETMQVYRQLPKGSLCILPKASHPFEQLDYALLSTIVKHFLADVG